MGIAQRFNAGKIGSQSNKSRPGAKEISVVLANSFPAANPIDAFDQAPNFGGDIARQSTVFIVQFLQGETQFAVQLIGSRGDQVMHQKVKPIRFNDKASAAQPLGKRFNDHRELRWPR